MKLHKICNKLNANYDTAYNFYNHILPIFNNAIESDDKFMKKFYEHQITYYATSHDVTVEMNYLLHNIRKKQFGVTKKQVSLLMLLRYSMMIDGVFAYYCTIIFYTCYKSKLIKPEIVFKKEYRKNPDAVLQRFNTFNSVHNIKLSTKLKHIKINDVFEQFADCVDLGIRNSTAHLSCKLESNKILIPENKNSYPVKYRKIDMESAGSKFENIIHPMQAAIICYLDNKYGEIANMLINSSNNAQWPL